MKIMCDVCGKHVDGITSERDDRAQCQVIKAYCHGEEDVMRLPDYFVEELNLDERLQLQNATGVAFRITKLEMTQ